MLSLDDRRRSAVSIAAEIEEVGVSLLVLRPYATIYIKLMCCHSGSKSLLKMIHKNPCKQFAEDMSTKHMDYWNHFIWSDKMKINLFGSDGFKHV